MKTQLHIRESLPWIAAGAAWIAAVWIFAPDDSFWWLVVIGGVALVAYGLLVIVRDFNTSMALKLAALAVAGFVAAVFLHNAVSGVFGVEEGVFFALAIFGAPAVLVAALIRAVRPGRG